ncbi:MAG: tRNA 4-thiouridine(8) synthase ThiI, partial [Lachnospiraceae bacterium]|nr:tRNA 4-thiouridine(8) synthase ThiI [Lachnospiraceae bacterium]
MEKSLFRAFLIKYAEIAIKGKNRYMFEDALVASMRNALAEVEGEFEVTKEMGRIYVFVRSEDYDYDETITALKRVFGIVGICPVVIVEDTDFENVSAQVLKYIDDVYPDKNKTFKVNARRANKGYPLDSVEINLEMGGRILDAYPEMKVDVHHPQINLVIEVRKHV